MSKKRKSEASIEDIYRNKFFVPPKEQHLETIFEEPRQSKDGAPILTSVKKYKRYLHFDPTINKIEKRKRKAKKYFKKLKTGCCPVTRSSPKDSKSVDESLYKLHLLGDSSSDSESDSEVPKPKKRRLSSSFDDLKNAEHSDALKDISCTDIIETPKRNNESRTSLSRKESDIVTVSDNNDESSGSHGGIDTTTATDDADSQHQHIQNDSDAPVESPRRLPQKSLEILSF